MKIFADAVAHINNNDNIPNNKFLRLHRETKLKIRILLYLNKKIIAFLSNINFRIKNFYELIQKGAIKHIPSSKKVKLPA